MKTSKHIPNNVTNEEGLSDSGVLKKLIQSKPILKSLEGVDQKIDPFKCKKRPWTEEEDRLVVQLVLEYGPQKWTFIATHLQERIGKQCRERWHNHLNPQIRKCSWSDEEEWVLFLFHSAIGKKWAEIAKFIIGRTDNSIKNHWNSGMKKRLDDYSRRFLQVRDNFRSEGEMYLNKISNCGERKALEILLMNKEYIPSSDSESESDEGNSPSSNQVEFKKKQQNKSLINGQYLISSDQVAENDIPTSFSNLNASPNQAQDPSSTATLNNELTANMDVQFKNLKKKKKQQSLKTIHLLETPYSEEVQKLGSQTKKGKSYQKLIFDRNYENDPKKKIKREENIESLQIGSNGFKENIPPNLYLNQTNSKEDNSGLYYFKEPINITSGLNYKQIPNSVTQLSTQQNSHRQLASFGEYPNRFSYNNIPNIYQYPNQQGFGLYTYQQQPQQNEFLHSESNKKEGLLYNDSNFHQSSQTNYSAPQFEVLINNGFYSQSYQTQQEFERQFNQNNEQADGGQFDNYQYQLEARIPGQMNSNSLLKQLEGDNLIQKNCEIFQNEFHSSRNNSIELPISAQKNQNHQYGIQTNYGCYESPSRMLNLSEKVCINSLSSQKYIIHHCRIQSSNGEFKNKFSSRRLALHPLNLNQCFQSDEDASEVDTSTKI